MCIANVHTCMMKTLVWKLELNGSGVPVAAGCMKTVLTQFSTMQVEKKSSVLSVFCDCVVQIP